MDILFIGAHPDDCDFTCGGTAALMARRGDRVKFVSVTNGDRGHMESRYLGGEGRRALATRRMAEAKRAAAVFNGQFECLGVPDGDVCVTRELSEQVIRVIRSWGLPGKGPDLVVTNRPNDYHRDHRYTAQLVLDAVYMLTVPLMCPDVPHLSRMPVFAYWFDHFREGGGAFRPDVAVPIDEVMGGKTDMLVAHASQVFEWLPYNRGALDGVPADDAGKHRYVREQLERIGRSVVSAYRQAGRQLLPVNCEFAEAFQVSEYGRQPAAEELRKLFPVP